jgi:hypothetical protein
MRRRDRSYDHSADSYCDRHSDDDYNVLDGEQDKARSRGSSERDELWKDVIGCGV